MEHSGAFLSDGFKVHITEPGTQVLLGSVGRGLCGHGCGLCGCGLWAPWTVDHGLHGCGLCGRGLWALQPWALWPWPGQLAVPLMLPGDLCPFPLPLRLLPLVQKALTLG